MVCIRELMKQKERCIHEVDIGDRKKWTNSFLKIIHPLYGIPIIQQHIIHILALSWANIHEHTD